MLNSRESPEHPARESLKRMQSNRPTLRYLRPRCCSLHMKEKKGRKRTKEKGTKHREEGGREEKRDKSEKKIMYGLAGRGGFYVAVAVDDLRFLRVTHSARCMTETYKKKKKTKQRAALRAVKKLFTATYII